MFACLNYELQYKATFLVQESVDRGIFGADRSYFKLRQVCD
jgi:hypothetical protein